MTTETLLILKAASRQDKEAFTTLVQMHQGKIRAYLVRLCKHYDLADDLAQETFITAHRKLASFQGVGSFSGWLFSIAHNCFLQHLRKSKRRKEITEQYGVEQEILADHYEEISTAQMDLERMLSQLSGNETAAISLCHSFGFSHQEASEILAMPLGTVKTNINRGKRKLQEMLKTQEKLRSSSAASGERE